MNLQTLRWPVVVLTMAVALTALFGGGFVLKSRTVEEPLKAVYTSAPSVEKAPDLVKDGNGYTITVTLKDVPDFAAAYTALNQQTKQILKDLPYTIKIEDHHTAALDELNRRVSLYVQEGIATGQFATMADRVEQEAVKAGMTARVGVDTDHVYVQLKANDGYLYSVVPRPGRSTPATSSATAGGFGL
jgi:hypothetical protein